MKHSTILKLLTYVIAICALTTGGIIYADTLDNGPLYLAQDQARDQDMDRDRLRDMDDADQDRDRDRLRDRDRDCDCTGQADCDCEQMQYRERERERERLHEGMSPGGMDRGQQRMNMPGQGGMKQR